jgi:MoaA/NifB/PqqE/SkfB family radical SAM enzyme
MSAPVSERLNDLAMARAVPLSVTFELNKKCNLRCVHCYVDHRAPERFDTARVKEVLDDLAAAGTLHLTLTGGEVGLRRDLVEIVHHARRVRHFGVKLLTTGTLFDDARVEALVDAGLSRVHLSVYSHRPEVHDGVTLVKGSLERTLRAVRLFVARGVKVRLQCPVMKDTASELGALVALAESLGAEYAFDPFLSGHETGAPDLYENAVGAEQYGALMRDRALRGRLHMDRVFDKLAAGTFTWRRPDDTVCGAGRTVAYIDAAGHVFPCITWREPLGDLTRERFADIWERSPAVQRIRALRARDVRGSDALEAGGVFFHCFGRAHAETGDALQPAPSHQTLARAIYDTWREERPEAVVEGPGSTSLRTTPSK